MSKLKELIDQYCPNGVPFKKLGDILDYEQPTQYIVKSTEYDDSYILENLYDNLYENIDDIINEYTFEDYEVL